MPFMSDFVSLILRQTPDCPSMGPSTCRHGVVVMTVPRGHPKRYAPEIVAKSSFVFAGKSYLAFTREVSLPPRLLVTVIFWGLAIPLNFAV